jgi:hypothetical protein
VKEAMAQKTKALRTRKKLEGQYANYFQVGYNAFEFVIEFGQYFPENDGAELYTRIITSPAYAKSLLETLNASIEAYEKAYGRIDLQE